MNTHLSATEAASRSGRSHRARWLGLALPWLVAASAGAFTLTNVEPVNVTPDGFGVIFQTSTPCSPAITLYADPAGQTNLDGSLGLEWFPLHTGDPTLTEPYLQRQSQTAIRSRTQQRGQAFVRISGCQPGATYYYRVEATDTNGASVSWPASGPLPGVTTALANAFVPDSRQLVIDLGGPEAEGQIVLLSNANAAYALAAVAGDGVPPDQVFFNLSDLMSLAGGTNYIPLGDQEFTVALPGRTGASATNVYAIRFTSQFVVGTAAQEMFLGEDVVVLGLGRAVMRAGDSGSVPLTLISTAGLTNVSFALDLPTGTLAGLALQGNTPAVGGVSVQTLSATRSLLSLQAAAGQVFQGTQELATLSFTANAAQHSAFLALRPAQIVASRGDATTVSNLLTRPGRVAVVGPEPLVETVLGTTGGPEVLLYGHTGAPYQVQFTPSLAPPIEWRLGPRRLLTNIVEAVNGNWPANSSLFFRAYEMTGDITALDAVLQGGNRNLLVYGQPGINYQLQYATNISGIVTWHTQLNFTLTGRLQTLTNTGPAGPMLFYRIAKP